MTGDPSIFSYLDSHNCRNATISDNGKRETISKGIVGKSPLIENVYLVEGLKHNLLSIS